MFGYAGGRGDEIYQSLMLGLDHCEAGEQLLEQKKFLQAKGMLEKAWNLLEPCIWSADNYGYGKRCDRYCARIQAALAPHLSPRLVSPLSPTLGSLGRMSLHLSPSPTLVALGRMSLHLSSTCVPHLSLTLGVLERRSLHLSPTLVSHSGFLGPHEFTLVSHLSPTLGALGRMILHLSPTCPSHSGALGRMSLHLSPPCLPHLSLTLGALGPMSLHLSPTCLPLWVPWAA